MQPMDAGFRPAVGQQLEERPLQAIAHRVLRQNCAV
jgi:hypothetical protein